MHGRVKKDVVEPSPEEKEKQREQVRTARGLFGKLLELRQNKVYNEQALDMTSKALQFHPEFPTLWGYRRELLTSGKISKPLRELLEVEMKLLEKAWQGCGSFFLGFWGSLGSMWVFFGRYGLGFRVWVKKKNGLLVEPTKGHEEAMLAASSASPL